MGGMGKRRLGEAELEGRGGALLLTHLAWKNKHKDRNSSLIKVLCWKLCFIWGRTNPIESLKIFFESVSVFVVN